MQWFCGKYTEPCSMNFRFLKRALRTGQPSRKAGLHHVQLLVGFFVGRRSFCWRAEEQSIFTVFPCILYRLIMFCPWDFFIPLFCGENCPTTCGLFTTELAPMLSESWLLRVYGGTNPAIFDCACVSPEGAIFLWLWQMPGWTRM